jgi:hypothetical protein
MAGQIITQNDHRRDIRPRDQFNRKWYGSIEKATNDFCSGVRPARWTDPLRTPQNYVVLNTDENGDKDISQCTVLFGPWLDQVRQDEVDWYQNLLEIAARKYSQLDPDNVPHLENDPFIRGLAGRKPFPSSKVLELAQAGDKQFLGLEPLDDEHRKLLGLSNVNAAELAKNAAATVTRVAVEDATIPPPPNEYKPFLTWAYKYQGVKDLKDAATMWAEHKARFEEKVAA